MVAGIDQLLHQLHTALTPVLQQQGAPATLYFAQFAHDRDHYCEYFQYEPTQGASSLGERELFSASALRDLHLFCGYENSAADPFLLSFRGETYYARPLSLWLNPIGFVFLPATGIAQWEQQLQRSDLAVQSQLTQLMDDHLLSSFPIDRLIQLKSPQLDQEFGAAVAQWLLPRSWYYDEQAFHFSNGIFLDETPASDLIIPLSTEHSLRYETPANCPLLAEQLDLAWDYQPDRLQAQAEALSRHIQHLYTRLRRDYANIRELIQQHQTVPVVSQQIEQVENSVSEIKSQLKHIEKNLLITKERIKLLYTQIGSTDPEDFHFYQITSQSYKVVFEGIEVRCLRKRVCHIIYTLLSNPGTTYDMRLLDMEAKALDDVAETSEESPELTELEKRRKLIKYLIEGYVKEEDFQRASRAEAQEYQERIRRGITFCQFGIRDYPDLQEELMGLLHDYRKYQERYGDPRLDEAFEETPLLDLQNRISKRKARERISVQLDTNGTKKLRAHNHSSFADYLQQVIVRDSVDGNHLYTFRPERAAQARWQAIGWRLNPPNE